MLITRDLENHHAGPTSSKRLQGATKLSEAGTLIEQNTELEVGVGWGGVDKVKGQIGGPTQQVPKYLGLGLQGNIRVTEQRSGAAALRV